MLSFAAAVLSGFIFLVWGADRFVVGAAGTARNLGVSPLVIGLTIVGFGTSAPEMIVSGVAAWQGNPGLSVGNAIGSNITNIALVIGVTSMITPLNVHSQTLKRELPLLLGVMALSLFLLLDRDLSRLDGIILLSGFAALLYWMTLIGIRTRHCNPDAGVADQACDPLAMEFAEEVPKDISLSAGVLWIVVGLVVLLLSSHILVWGAVNMARTFGVSDLVIGLTIVAIGTSLPELAASVASAVKKEHDIALGNVLGSNMFNLLAVMGLPGLIRPFRVDGEVLSRDYPVMITLTVALFVMAYGFRGPGRVNRVEGTALLLCFIGYEAFLYMAS